MPETIFDPNELSALYQEHVHRAGKFFQMCCGTSSQITRYEGGIIHLEIRMREQKGRGSAEHLARNIAKSWRYGPRLTGATGYKAWIYKVNHASGFIVDGKRLADWGAIQSLVASLKAAANPCPDILFKIVEGKFDNE
jgi:hypothetical protein